MITTLMLSTALLIALTVWLVRKRQSNAQLQIQRKKYIAEYAFPTSLRFKLDQAYPDLSGEQIGMIVEGLRVWFQLVAAHPRTELAMPSHAVDTAWHEFILLTKNYAFFCENAFGKFLHHTPHSVSDRAQKDGLARTYGLSAGLVGGAALVGMAGMAGAAVLGGRDLFNLDQTLGVAEGNRYTADDLSAFERRYRDIQAASADGGGGGDGGTISGHGHPSGVDGNGAAGGGGSGDAGGGGGGDGGGCGGGCGS